MDQELELYKRMQDMKNGVTDPSLAGANIDRLKELLKDQNGLGIVSGVGIMATLALLASKAKDQKLLRKAIKSQIPINTNYIKPGLAVGLGGAMGWAGKHFSDKYNKENGDY